MFLSLSPYQTDMGLYTLKKFCDIDDDIHKQVCKSFGINPQEIEPSQKFDKGVGEIREEEVERIEERGITHTLNEIDDMLKKENIHRKPSIFICDLMKDKEESQRKAFARIKRLIRQNRRISIL